MKRILTIALSILCLASCLSFCACGGGATFERGSKADSSYTNQSMNLVFNKPTGCVFYTDEQLAELMDVAKDMVNDKELLHFSYERYLENHFRKTFELAGTPIRIWTREKKDKEELGK